MECAQRYWEENKTRDIASDDTDSEKGDNTREENK